MTPTLSVEAYLQPYLELPEDLPQRVKDLADRVTRGTDTILARAIALQQWFRDPDEFAYDLRQRPGTGKAAILAFLEDRRGYCEQFASTMAVMARYLKIPARVNVGFTPGTPNPDGTRTISAHDAHAWPELFMPGVGWTRFEPTPGSAASNPDVPNWLAPKPEDEPAGSEGDETDESDRHPDAPGPAGASGAAGAGPRPDLRGVPAGPDVPCIELPPHLRASGLPDSAVRVRPLVQAATCSAMAALGPDPAVSASRGCSARWSGPGAGAWPRPTGGWRRELAWTELRDSAVDLGYEWPRGADPAADLGGPGRATASSGPHGVAALSLVTQHVERVRYAPGGDATPDVGRCGRRGPGPARARPSPPAFSASCAASCCRAPPASLIGTWWLRARARTVAARQASCGPCTCAGPRPAGGTAGQGSPGRTRAPADGRGSVVVQWWFRWSADG